MPLESFEPITPPNRSVAPSPPRIRQPRWHEGGRIWEFVKACGTLDLNSAYYYYIMCRDFAETSRVAERNGEIVGYCSGYRRPEQPQTLFIWQIGVGVAARGQGIGRRLLASLLDSKACRQVRTLETTIFPQNQKARALFTSIARSYDASVQESIFLSTRDFPGKSHEPEILLTIRPLNQNDRKER